MKEEAVSELVHGRAPGGCAVSDGRVIDALDPLLELVSGYKAVLLDVLGKRAADIATDEYETSLDAIIDELDDFMLDELDEPALMRAAPAFMARALLEEPVTRHWAMIQDCGLRPSIGGMFAYVLIDKVRFRALAELIEETPQGVTRDILRALGEIE
jgi:hypothetical protein